VFTIGDELMWSVIGMNVAAARTVEAGRRLHQLPGLRSPTSNCLLRSFSHLSFRCFCCFCRKLSADGITFAAETLEFRQPGRAKNSVPAPP